MDINDQRFDMRSKGILVKQGLKSLTIIILEIILKLLFQ
jgi:hypothetical protein